MFCHLTFWIPIGALWINDLVQYEIQDLSYNDL
jgi:hypothetical protein